MRRRCGRLKCTTRFQISQAVRAEQPTLRGASSQASSALMWVQNPRSRPASRPVQRGPSTPLAAAENHPSSEHSPALHVRRLPFSGMDRRFLGTRDTQARSHQFQRAPARLLNSIHWPPGRYQIHKIEQQLFRADLNLDFEACTAVSFRLLSWAIHL